MKGLGTKAIHVGEPQGEGEPITMPVYQASTFYLGEEAYASIERGDASDRNVYTRWGNPTLTSAARKIASLEGCERALVTSSGMGAISAVVLSHLQKGDVMLSSRELYGGTYAFFGTLSRFGIRVEYVDQADPEAISSRLTPHTRLIYLESVTNPLLNVAPLDEIAAISMERSIPIAIDNTFATPVNLRPAEFGAGLIVHSATKYLGGHSDIVAGAVASSGEVMERVWLTGIRLGATLDPHAGYLLSRGIKTLHLRMQRHNENAMGVAEFLSEHPRVTSVRYPGLECHPQHALARKMFDGFGGMVTFEVKGGLQAAKRTLSSLGLFAEASSLGGVESLASMPVNTSHAHVPPDERRRMGISEGMVRLSVGVEDLDDLIEDLDAALRTA